MRNGPEKSGRSRHEGQVKAPPSHTWRGLHQIVPLGARDHVERRAGEFLAAPGVLSRVFRPPFGPRVEELIAGWCGQLRRWSGSMSRSWPAKGPRSRASWSSGVAPCWSSARVLTGAQLAAQAVPPSRLSLLGLVRHVTEAERTWLRRRFGGEVLGSGYARPDRPDAAFEEVDADQAEHDLARLTTERTAARRAVATLPLEHVFVSDRWGPMQLRWAYCHLTSEYDRHNGPADLLRERIDGTAGSQPAVQVQRLSGHAAEVSRWKDTVTGGWGGRRAPGCGRRASGSRAARGRSRPRPRGSGWSRSVRR